MQHENVDGADRLPARASGLEAVVDVTRSPDPLIDLSVESDVFIDAMVAAAERAVAEGRSLVDLAADVTAPRVGDAGAEMAVESAAIDAPTGPVASGMGAQSAATTFGDLATAPKRSTKRSSFFQAQVHVDRPKSVVASSTFQSAIGAPTNGVGERSALLKTLRSTSLPASSPADSPSGVPVATDATPDLSIDPTGATSAVATTAAGEQVYDVQPSPARQPSVPAGSGVDRGANAVGNAATGQAVTDEEPEIMASPNRSSFKTALPFVAAAVLFVVGALFAYSAFTGDDDDPTIDEIFTPDRVSDGGLDLTRRCDAVGFEGVVTSTLDVDATVRVVVQFVTESGELIHQAQLNDVSVGAGQSREVAIPIVERLVPESLAGQPFTCEASIERLQDG